MGLLNQINVKLIISNNANNISQGLLRPYQVTRRFNSILIITHSYPNTKEEQLLYLIGISELSEYNPNYLVNYKLKLCTLNQVNSSLRNFYSHV